MRATRPTAGDRTLRWTSRTSLNCKDAYSYVLGVKGSRVRIPPSRPEPAGQKGFRSFSEAPSRSSAAKRGSHSLTRTWHSRGFGLLLEDLVHGRCALGQRGQLSAPNLTLDAANRTNYSRRQRSRAGGDL